MWITWIYLSMSRRGYPRKGDTTPPLETNSLPRSMYMRSNTYSAYSSTEKKEPKSSPGGKFSHRRQYSDESLWIPSRLWNMWPHSSLQRKSSLSAKSLPHIASRQKRAGKKKVGTRKGFDNGLQLHFKLVIRLG